MPRATPTLPLSATVLLFAALALSAAAGEAQDLIDRIVAVVNEDAILLSDIRRAIGLEQVEPIAGESQSQLERRVLDGLIDHRLRLREVEQHDFGQLPGEEIDHQLERIRSRFGSPAELEKRLRSLGLDEKGLRLLVTRQLRVLIYVEKRLGPRVFINPDDIRAYYNDVLSFEMRGQGLETPPLDDVREQVRELLHELELNRQIETWTEELRLEADIVDYLDRRLDTLPPVHQRIELDR